MGRGYWKEWGRTVAAGGGWPRMRVSAKAVPVTARLFVAKDSAGIEGAWFGVTLTWIAGYVDAVGYLVLANIYTANQSGNTVALGVHLSRGEWREAIFRALPIAAFVPGVLAGMLIVEASERAQMRARLTPALMIESVLLGCFMGCAAFLMGNYGRGSAEHLGLFALLISMSGVAMGLQNGALQQIGALKNVHTYVTGTLVSTMESVSAWIWWVWDTTKGPPARPASEVFKLAWSHKTFRQAVFSTSLWIGYLAGACIGAILLPRCGVLCISVPLGILVVLAIVDWLRPMSTLVADPKRDHG